MSGEHAQERIRTKRLAELGTLFAGFAHEIRNPLSTIGLNLQLVKEDFGELESPRDKRIHRRLSVVESEVQRLQGIVEQFLGYVRVPRLELALTRPEQLVQELSEFETPQLSERNIRLRSFVEPGLAPIAIDPAQIRAVLVNLVRNAAEALPDGGDIMIGVRGDGDEVLLQVIDTGQGMSPEVQANAFRPYFSTKKAGTGLGLPIVRRIIEQHGGTIELASELGKGSQFTIRLPRTVPPDDLLATDDGGSERAVPGGADSLEGREQANGGSDHGQA